MTASLAVLILTHNEARHIARAIASVAPLATEIFVIDSHSTDDTVAIAESAGARVLRHPFVSHARQFQWGLDHAPITSDWVMRLDADEIVEPDLAARLDARLPTLPADVSGIFLDRKHLFMGRWIRHGGRYPLRLLRIVRRGLGRVEERWMDEHLVLTAGRATHIPGGFADHRLDDLTSFTARHNGYATREAAEILIARLALPARPHAPLAGQAARRRRIKEQVFNRLPFPLAALAYFLWRYLFQLGFLDGREGLVYHVLQGFWYRFLVGARVMELERALVLLPDRATRLARLAELTGLPLGPAAPAPRPSALPVTSLTSPWQWLPHAFALRRWRSRHR